MSNQGGLTVTVKLANGALRDMHSKKRERSAAHADALTFYVDAIVVTSTKA